MPALDGLGKLLMALGLGVAAVGLVMSLMGKAPGAGQMFGWVGRLPGDLFIKREHVTVYIPLTTGLLISLAGSLLLYFIMKR